MYILQRGWGLGDRVIVSGLFYFCLSGAARGLSCDRRTPDPRPQFLMSLTENVLIASFATLCCMFSPKQHRSPLRSLWNGSAAERDRILKLFICCARENQAEEGEPSHRTVLMLRHPLRILAISSLQQCVLNNSTMTVVTMTR